MMYIHRLYILYGTNFPDQLSNSVLPYDFLFLRGLKDWRGRHDIWRISSELNAHSLHQQQKHGSESYLPSTNCNNQSPPLNQLLPVCHSPIRICSARRRNTTPKWWGDRQRLQLDVISISPLLTLKPTAMYMISKSNWWRKNKSIGRKRNRPLVATNKTTIYKCTIKIVDVTFNPRPSPAPPLRTC